MKRKNWIGLLVTVLVLVISMALTSCNNGGGGGGGGNTETKGGDEEKKTPEYPERSELMTITAGTFKDKKITIVFKEGITTEQETMARNKIAEAWTVSPLGTYSEYSLDAYYINTVLSRGFVINVENTGSEDGSVVVNWRTISFHINVISALSATNISNTLASQIVGNMYPMTAQVLDKEAGKAPVRLAKAPIDVKRLTKQAAAQLPMSKRAAQQMAI